MKLRDPAHEIEVFERNAPGVTFGWGVVFSDLTVENITANDPVSAADHHRRVRALGRHRRPLSAASRSLRAATASSASAASACSKSCRTARASSESCCTSKPNAIPPIPSGATMISSSLRTAPTRASAMPTPDAFGVDVDVRANKFVWLGTSKVFDAFTFAFEETEHGWIWAHAYRFAPDCSTFIVECSEETWRALRLRPDGPGRKHRRLRKAVRQISRRPRAPVERRRICVGSAAWLNFRRIKCERWSQRQRHPARRRRAHRAFLDRQRHQARARRRDQARRGAQPRGPRASKPRSTNIRRSATSKCSSSRTARATRPNGSRRCTATSISSRCNSLIRCSPAASASATRTSACATANGSKASSAGSGSARPTAARTRPRRRCSRRSSCARWRSRTASPSRRWRCIRRSTARPTTSTSSTTASARWAAPGSSSPR